MMAIVPKTSGARIHGQLVGILAREVLGGERAPGDALPNEDDLASRFGVSRSSVREAVKTLSAKGLIESRQRVGARVRARADWHMLDPDLLAWHPDIRRDRPLVASLLEARRIIEPAAAELAAERASDIRPRRHRGRIRGHGPSVAARPRSLLRRRSRIPWRHHRGQPEHRALRPDRDHRGRLAGLVPRHQQRHRGPAPRDRTASRRVGAVAPPGWSRGARRHGPRARSRRTRPRSGGVVGKADARGTTTLR